MGRSKFLQRPAAEMRNDLMLGEIPISLDRFGGKAMRAIKPRAQMISDREL
jgi:hypothetical protein